MHPYGRRPRRPSRWGPDSRDVHCISVPSPHSSCRHIWSAGHFDKSSCRTSADWTSLRTFASGRHSWDSETAHRCTAHCRSGTASPHRKWADVWVCCCSCPQLRPIYPNSLGSSRHTRILHKNGQKNKIMPVLVLDHTAITHYTTNYTKKSYILFSVPLRMHWPESQLLKPLGQWKFSV